jgi:hypothetical protein
MIRSSTRARSITLRFVAKSWSSRSIRLIRFSNKFSLLIYLNLFSSHLFSLFLNISFFLFINKPLFSWPWVNLRAMISHIFKLLYFHISLS